MLYRKLKAKNVRLNLTFYEKFLRRFDFLKHIGWLKTARLLFFFTCHFIPSLLLFFFIVLSHCVILSTYFYVYYFTNKNS
jgi:hypothetical protein